MVLNRCAQGHCFSGEAKYCPFCGGVAETKQAFPERMVKSFYPVLVSKGSVGEVYRLGNDALKVIECGADPEKFRNALQEVGMLQRLADVDGVMPVLDSEIDDVHKIAYIRMPCLQTATDYLRRKNAGDYEKLRLLIRLCEILARLEDRGVCHLDLRPKNLFVDEFGKLYLGDFSSALPTEKLAETAVPRGTILFMAPEVLRQGRCSVQSEIYSVGLILYYWFSDNTIPFGETDTTDRAVERRMAGEPLPTIRRQDDFLELLLNSVIARACAFAPESRYQSYKDLQRYLQALQRQCVPVNVPPMPCPSPMPSAPMGMPPSVAASGKKKGVLGKLKNLLGGKEKKAPVPPPAPMVFPSVQPGTEADDQTVTATVPKPYRMSEVARTMPPMPSPVGSSRFDADERADSVMLTAPSGFRPGRYDADERAYSTAVSFSAWEPMAKPKPEPKPPTMSRVQFSALAPKAVQPGAYALIDLYMYEEAFRHVVEEAMAMSDTPMQEKRGSAMQVAHNAAVRVVLSSPNIPLEDCEETQTWWGDYLNFSFAAEVPEDYAKSQILFKAMVYINDVIATRLQFVVRCDGSNGQTPPLVRQDVCSAFVSYASQDRSRVAMIVQGMQKARPDLDVFFDVETLRSGEDWETALYREIDRRDVLYLCWSRNARDSQWVTAEWHYAMEHKGVDCIEPIPIEPPRKCPPPVELQRKHFSDRLLYIIDAEI